MRSDTCLSSHRVVVRRIVGDEGQNPVDRAKGLAIADDQAAQMAETLFEGFHFFCPAEHTRLGKGIAPAVGSG